jgi:transposase-like protein
MASLLKSLYAEFGTRGAVCTHLGISANTLYVWLLRCGLQQKTVLVDRVLTSEVKS